METYTNYGWEPSKSYIYRKLLIRRILRRVWNFLKRNTENGLIFGTLGVSGFVFHTLFHYFY